MSQKQDEFAQPKVGASVSYIYMKRYILAVMSVALSFLIFEGCTNEPTARNAGNTRGASNTNPNERVYSQQDLERTGETQVGPALEKADPDIRSNGR